MNEQFKKLSEEIRAKISEQLQSKEMQDFIAATKAAEDTGSFEVVISTADLDRQGESIDQNGWELDFYRTNPIVLWAHDYYSLPIAITDEIKVENGQLLARGRFAPESANPFAQQVRRLYDLKIVRATSVGFIAKETEGSLIMKAELLEFSFVPVPANPFALSLRKAQELGINSEMLAMKGIALELKAEGDPCALDDGTEGILKPDAEGNLVCMPKPEEKKTKPEICEPDSPNFDPEACAAIFCDPESPDYNQEFCDLMKAQKPEKKDVEKIGAELSAMQSEIDNSIVIHSKKIIEIVQSEYGEPKKESINENETPPQKGGEGEEQPDGTAPKQRSESAGLEAAMKELDDFLMARAILRSVSTQTSTALERMNKKLREQRRAHR